MLLDNKWWTYGQCSWIVVLCWWIRSRHTCFVKKIIWTLKNNLPFLLPNTFNPPGAKRQQNANIMLHSSTLSLMVWFLFSHLNNASPGRGAVFFNSKSLITGLYRRVMMNQQNHVWSFLGFEEIIKKLFWRSFQAAATFTSDPQGASMKNATALWRLTRNSL